MRRLTIHLDIAFGRDDPAPPERDSQLDALVDRVGHNDPDPRSELDHRHPIGFHAQERP